jgi:hypothetical protein
VFSQEVIVAKKKSGGSPSCSVGEDSTSGEYQSMFSIGTSAGNYYAGQYEWYDDTTARCVCKVTFTLTAQGSITGKTYVARIWSLSGTSLDTQQGASTGVTGSNSWSATDVDFTFSTCVNISASTYYAITLDNGGDDDTNYVQFTHVDGSTLTGKTGWWTSGKTISNDSANDPSMKIWW